MTFDVEFLINVFQKISAGSESLVVNLEKVRYDKSFQSSDLFDFAIFPFPLLTRAYIFHKNLIIMLLQIVSCPEV